MPWICADCGAEHDDHSPPCRECGSERFAQLAEDEAEITSMADVQWACKQCGRIHQRNSPPCKDCGGMQFSAVEDLAEESDDDRPFTTPGGRSATSDNTPATTGETDQTAYYLGVVGGTAGVVFLPFVFGFLAVVESPLRLLGRSGHNVLPGGMSRSDGVRGSFDAFAWFGHGIWFLTLLFVGLVVLFRVFL